MAVQYSSHLDFPVTLDLCGNLQMQIILRAATAQCCATLTAVLSPPLSYLSSFSSSSSSSPLCFIHRLHPHWACSVQFLDPLHWQNDRDNVDRLLGGYLLINSGLTQKWMRCMYGPCVKTFGEVNMKKSYKLLFKNIYSLGFMTLKNRHVQVCMFISMSVCL